MDILGAFQVALAQLIGPSAIFYALLAIGLNLHFGYTGLLNFGQIGFALVGGYGVGVMTVTYQQPLWVGILVGLAGAGLLAVLLGIPTLRLRADYLAIATIATAEVLRLVFRSTVANPVTGSTNGLFGYADPFTRFSPFDSGKQYSLLGLRFVGDDLWAMVVGWTLVLVLCGFVYLLTHSPWGRVLKAVREDEDAARALGKNVFVYKLQALVLGGMIGGLGGVFNALQTKSLHPDFFSTAQTFYAFGALLLGGAATVFGPVIGAMLFWFLLAIPDALLRQAIAGPDPLLPFTDAQVGAIRFILLGILIALLMVFRPQGILGSKREVQLDG
ncbi:MULTISPECIES: branched-chain amino acid ABC transporter permease [Mycolicibacterium]|jgi:neutral amino acid transport system permease protein|uniref:Branched-chain amino acid ABC transporter permease n=2 Tax=Mycolicibacterium TaxID=1866885 RepID=A0A378TNC8_9MYCO|nr:MULTISPECIES: branched-chain amino acid ABC transporter permease [Mycolicibacterium]MCV7183495.1 branched-chain amino acid ABC transporter permease [Mycolicibacterium murale]BBY89482.1 branched-chain amino acid ABC transporter permease [Mycolicibacterium tokaiense]GFG59166.1 branched-chain amino acid ABC transporter permease [Mycolicibacterium murale]STZ62130.1 branched-chain amino acid ABC transporter permease [Mycolicibacterium tokaiense]